ncbi:MAG: hypothetical protein WCT03_06800 [Candidatus Obscuribacterales bacterium]|jgi:hypothetical protein
MSKYLTSPIFDQYRYCETYSDQGHVFTNDWESVRFCTSFQRGKYLRFEWIGNAFDRLDDGVTLDHVILLIWENQNFYLDLTGPEAKEPETTSEVSSLVDYDQSFSFASGIILPLLINSAELYKAIYVFPLEELEDKSIFDRGSILDFDQYGRRSRLHLSSARTIERFISTDVVTIEQKLSMLAHRRETDPNGSIGSKKFMETTSIFITCADFFDASLNHPPENKFRSPEDALKPRLHPLP